MNISIVSGRVTKEITAKGKTALFTLANERDYPFNKDQNGNKVSNFLTCKILGEKNIERAKQWLSKGTAIIVFGHTFRDTWRENGEYKEFNYILVEKWEFQAGKGNGESEQSENESQGESAPQQSSPQPAPDNGFMDIPADLEAEIGSLPFR